MISASRKRKSSTNSSKNDKLSKRARLLSQLWDPEEEVETEIQTSLSESSARTHNIKGIVGERSEEYLIDWADNSVTGEDYEADWVRRIIAHFILAFVLWNSI